MRQIKLDISLTRNIDTDPKRRALASALIAFARETQARIVAEGVETAAELRMLKRPGAGCAQGYFLARRTPVLEVDHRADRLARVHQLEGLVDVLDAHGVRDEGCEFDLALHGLLHHPR